MRIMAIFLFLVSTIRSDIVKLQNAVLKNNKLKLIHSFTFMHDREPKITLSLNAVKKYSESTDWLYFAVLNTSIDCGDRSTEMQSWCDTFPKLNESVIANYSVKLNENVDNYETPLKISYFGRTYSYLLLCSNLSTQSVSLNGMLQYLNSYGYLSGEKFSLFYSYLPFIVVYVLGLLCWIAHCYIFSTHVKPVHYIILVLLLCTGVEATARFAQCIALNENAHANPAITTIIILVNIFRNAGLRLLILLLSSGYSLQFKIVNIVDY